MIEKSDCFEYNFDKSTNTVRMLKEYNESGKRYLYLHTNLMYSLWHVCLIFQKDAPADCHHTVVSLSKLKKYGEYRQIGVTENQEFQVVFDIFEDAAIFWPDHEYDMRMLKFPIEFPIGRQKLYCVALQLSNDVGC